MNQRVSPLQVRLMVFFVSCLVISNILANRLVQVGTWSIDAGTMLFPVTYVLSDLFSEVYGYKWSRTVTWWAASMNLLFAVLVVIANALPAPEFYDPIPFQLALGSSFRIVVASLVSYVLGDWVNDIVFRKMREGKQVMEGFTFRAMVSSVAGQLADSALFVVIAFGGIMSVADIVGMISLNLIAKLGYEILVLPITYKITQRVHISEKRYENWRNIK